VLLWQGAWCARGVLSLAFAPSNHRYNARVRVAVNSDVMPSSQRSSGHRTVLLTRFPSILGVQSG